MGLNGDVQRIEQLGWVLFFKILNAKDNELEILNDYYKSPIPKQFRWIKQNKLINDALLKKNYRLG